MRESNKDLVQVDEPSYLMVCLCDDDHKNPTHQFGYAFTQCEHHNAVRLVDLVKDGVNIGLCAFLDNDGDIKKLTPEKLGELLKK